MNWKKYKTVLSNEHCHGVVRLVEYMLSNILVEEPKERIFLAALAEAAQHIKAKLVDYRKHYNCTFTPVQSIAIETLLTQYVLPQVHQLGDFENRMLQLQIGILNTYNR
jgi:hypothetical protein